MPRSLGSSPQRRSMSPYCKPPPKGPHKPLSHEEFTRLIDQRLIQHLQQLKESHNEQRQCNKKYASTLVPRMDLQEYIPGPSPRVEAIVELPGLQKEEVFLRVEDGNLVVHGERKLKFPRPFTLSSTAAQQQQLGSNLASIILGSPDHAGASLKEIRYGKFRRDIPLPRGTLPSDIKACLNEGVLFLTWPLPSPTAVEGASKPDEVEASGTHTSVSTTEVSHPLGVKNEDTSAADGPCDMSE